MHILRARPDDAAILTDIAFAAKRHWRYPESWIESWRAALTIQPEFIASHETWMAVMEDSPVGFYALACKECGVDLQHLWVLPHAMGRGVGRALFRHAVERTKHLGIREVEIESDPNAEKFYQHMGAHRVGFCVRSSGQQRRELPILIYEIDGQGKQGRKTDRASRAPKRKIYS